MRRTASPGNRSRWATARPRTPAGSRWPPPPPIRCRTPTLKQRHDGSILRHQARQGRRCLRRGGPHAVAADYGLPPRSVPHPSLPRGGSGTLSNGSFILSRLQAATVAADATPVAGRSVRIKLPGVNRPPLALAEVQVFSDGENVAHRGWARQSSTQGLAAAKLANDGKTAGNARVAWRRLHRRGRRQSLVGSRSRRSQTD